MNAFRALGPGPTRREVALVAKALREAGDDEVGPLLDYENNPELWARGNAIADEAGVYGFVALDLALAFHTRQLRCLIAEPEGGVTEGDPQGHGARG
jgi:hypothetical protein